jgi:hypothetical protein
MSTYRAEWALEGEERYVDFYQTDSDLFSGNYSHIELRDGRLTGAPSGAITIGERCRIRSVVVDCALELDAAAKCHNIELCDVEIRAPITIRTHGAMVRIYDCTGLEHLTVIREVNTAEVSYISAPIAHLPAETAIISVRDREGNTRKFADAHTRRSWVTAHEVLIDTPAKDFEPMSSCPTKRATA